MTATLFLKEECSRGPILVSYERAGTVTRGIPGSVFCATSGSVKNLQGTYIYKTSQNCCGASHPTSHAQEAKNIPVQSRAQGLSPHMEQSKIPLSQRDVPSFVAIPYKTAYHLTPLAVVLRHEV